ncbi:unnamed protein product [Closterium sp. Yama58-4]|nr:unnamed protein product [Closterium sp. Yama58-4]
MSCAEPSVTRRAPAQGSSSSRRAAAPTPAAAVADAVAVAAADAPRRSDSVPVISAHELTRRFVFTDLLGEGKFGRVWRCLDRHGPTSEPLACKQILTAHLTAEQRLALHREIATLRRLQGHPNVLRLHAICDGDGGALEGLGSETKSRGSGSSGSGWEDVSVAIRELVAWPGVYLITELCTGGDLFDLIDQFEHGVDELTAAGIFVQIARAVEWCHLHDIVHRDIKPENVLITGQAPSSSPASKRASDRRSIFAKNGICGPSSSYSSCSPICNPVSTFCPSFCPTSLPAKAAPAPPLLTRPATSSCASIPTSSSFQDLALLSPSSPSCSPSSSSPSSSTSSSVSSHSCSSSPYHAFAASSPLPSPLPSPVASSHPSAAKALHSNSNSVPPVSAPWDSPRNALQKSARASIFPHSRSDPSGSNADAASGTADAASPVTVAAAAPAATAPPAHALRPAIPRPQVAIPRAYSAAEISPRACHSAAGKVIGESAAAASPHGGGNKGEESEEAIYPSLFGGSAEPEVRLADFGMACEVPPGSAIIGLAGSEPYEAPEMVEMKKYDHQADVWSLGVLLHTLLSATWPEFPDGKRELVQEDLTVTPWLSISEDAKDLIRQMLVVDPNKRLDIHCVLQHPWVVKWMRRRQRGRAQRGNQEAPEPLELQREGHVKEQLLQQQQQQQQQLLQQHQQQGQLQQQEHLQLQGQQKEIRVFQVDRVPAAAIVVARKRRSSRTSSSLVSCRSNSSGNNTTSSLATFDNPGSSLVAVAATASERSGAATGLVAEQRSLQQLSQLREARGLPPLSPVIHLDRKQQSISQRPPLPLKLPRPPILAVQP